jgi:hypothetical protein
MKGTMKRLPMCSERYERMGLIWRAKERLGLRSIWVQSSRVDVAFLFASILAHRENALITQAVFPVLLARNAYDKKGYGDYSIEQIFMLQNSTHSFHCSS